MPDQRSRWLGEESESWEVLLHEASQANSCAYVYKADILSRNQSSLVAFTVPQSWKPGGGFSIVATHVDSPNLRIRPISKKVKEGYLQVGVETYV